MGVKWPGKYVSLQVGHAQWSENGSGGTGGRGGPS